MLTLASNERIPLLPHMRMIFEIRDLKHATPATVSRAGILYISTDDGTQWKSLIRSWLVAKGAEHSDEIVSALKSYFDKYMDDAFMWLLLHTEAVVPTEDVTRVEALLNMLDGVPQRGEHGITRSSRGCVCVLHRLGLGIELGCVGRWDRLPEDVFGLVAR